MKMHLLSAIRRAAHLLAAFAFATAAHAQTIPNPSFEANSYTVAPGYIFTAGNGGIAGWAINGAVGLNPAGSNPFADNGAVPQGSNVAFIQSVNLPGDYGNGVSLLNTVITGLTPGVSYTVSFRANSRTSSFYGAPTPSWSVNGEAFLPFTAAPSVGGTNAYYTVTRTFTATAATAPLNIMNNTAVTGGPADTTVLVDDFQIAVVPPVVTNTNDSGPGSLRQMLAYAATIPGANTVTFDPALSGATIVLGSEMVITDTASVSIDASNLPAGVTISGNNAHRIFSVSSGKNLALLGLTLSGGNGSGAQQNGNGGAIVNSGTLALTRCTLSGNSAAIGGALYQTSGTLTLAQCTLSGNPAVIRGGAIYNQTGALTLTNCTVTGNQSGGDGGAIYNQTGTLTLIQCTLSGNQVIDGDGGAINNDAGALTLTHSIVAGNTSNIGGPDIYNISTITPTGVNFIGEPANSGLTASATILTTAANGPINLAPLGNYGGPTQTMVPQPGSPAIDAATVIGGLTTDQRGFPRNVDGNGVGGAQPDLGAVELNRVVVTVATDQLDVPAGAQISLREAVRDGADLIAFAPALSGQTLSLASEITPAQASLRIDASDLPAGATIDGGPDTNRIFTVSTGKSLALLGLTLTGGNGGGAQQNGNGGAIVNFGTLALTRCTLSGNGGSNAGAILNDGGTLALTQCTLSGNQVSGVGGAIYQTTGTLTLTHCTFSGNQASSRGGAIYNSGQLVLTNSIVAGNSASFGGPDILYSNGTVTPTGRNFIGNPSGSGLIASSIILTTAANGPINLAPLGNYGGPTQTMALLPGSPARNAAIGSTISSDQRGFPIVGTPDLGAYEAGTFTNYNAYIWESLPVTATAPQHASGVDFDGDGITNGNEWLALTDAANPLSYLRITQIARSGSDILLTFPTVTGRTYSFEFNLNLATGTWTPLGFTRIGDGNIQTIPIGPVTGQSQLYFRIRIGP